MLLQEIRPVHIQVWHMGKANHSPFACLENYERKKSAWQCIHLAFTYHCFKNEAGGLREKKATYVYFPAHSSGMSIAASECNVLIPPRPYRGVHTHLLTIFKFLLLEREL